ADPGGKKASSRRKIHWSRPWLDHASVLHSGDYYLFETDSEEDDQSSLEEQRPPKQSAFQLAYQAWVTSAKSALKERQQQRTQPAAVEPGAGEQSRAGAEPVAGAAPPVATKAGDEEEDVVGRKRVGSNVVQRILDVLKFLWVLLLAMLDGLIDWLCTRTKQHVAMSTVLCVERYMLTQKLSKVRPGHVTQ
ncbi:hypothetical protein FKM82_026840, partial [Ascaphus truei]